MGKNKKRAVAYVAPQVICLPMIGGVAVVRFRLLVVWQWCDVVFWWCGSGAMSSFGGVAVVRCRLLVVWQWCDVVFSWCGSGAMSSFGGVAVVRCRLSWCGSGAFSFLAVCDLAHPPQADINTPTTAYVPRAR